MLNVPWFFQDCKRMKKQEFSTLNTSFNGGFYPNSEYSEYGKASASHATKSFRTRVRAALFAERADEDV